MYAHFYRRPFVRYQAFYIITLCGLDEPEIANFFPYPRIQYITKETQRSTPEPVRNQNRQYHLQKAFFPEIRQGLADRSPRVGGPRCILDQPYWPYQFSNGQLDHTLSTSNGLTAFGPRSAQMATSPSPTARAMRCACQWHLICAPKRAPLEARSKGAFLA